MATLNHKVHRFIYFLAFIVFCNLGSAQNLTTVNGVIRSADGDPLPGATIILKGSKSRKVSDVNGRFSIQAHLGQVLQIHFIGLKTEQVKITSDHLDIVLKENSQEIEGVVVTGYQNIKSRVFTGAAASVKLDEVKLNGVPDVSRMLEGRVAGLSIQNLTGSFGAAPRINIRGGASIMGNVQPLWVIDGVVYEDIVPITLDQLASGDAVTLLSSAIAGINSSDIENIQVLKDASATSIYGARAINGVIVITTRSGRRSSPAQFSYNGEWSMRSIPSYSSFDLLNSQETMSIYQEMDRKGYFSLQNILYGRRGGVYHQLYKGISTINPATGTYYIDNTELAKISFLREREYANTDWFNELFTYHPVQSHTLTFTSGGEQTTTYASIGVYDDRGWTIADNVRRITANVKNTFFSKNEKLRFTFSAQGNIRNQKSPGTIPQRKNTAIGSFERDFDINPFAYALGTSRTLRPRNSAGELEYYRNNWAPFNIINEYDNNYMKTDVLDFKVQGDLTYHITSNLSARALASVRRASTKNMHYITENSNVARAFRANENPYVAKENIYLLKDYEDPLKLPEVVLPHGGILNKTETSLQSYLGRVSLEYTLRRKEHDLQVFGFSELRSGIRDITPFQGYGIQYNKGNQVFNNPQIFDKIANDGGSYFSLSDFNERGVTFSSSLTYGYGGKYIVNGVINYEGSNASGKYSRARWLPTWNIGVKWNMDKEQFMSRFPHISRMALRLSYGLTAKMNENAINSSTIFRHFITHNPVKDERENALKILHLTNRDLTWEKMKELNFGIELGLLDDRISTTIDFYQRNSYDLIDLVRTSGIGGQAYKYANFGDMRTRGAEVSLHFKMIRSKSFSWNSSVTFSAMKQKITRLLNTPNTFEMVAGTGKGNIVGFPRGSLFSFNYQGLNQYGLPTFDFGLYPTDQGIYSEVSGANFLDTQYSKSYLIYHGPVEPTCLGGFSNTIRYKNWEFSCFITMQAGNKIRLNPTFDPTFGDLNVFSKEFYDRWINPGDELLTRVPTIPSQELINKYGKENIEKAYNTYNFSQDRVADGSFVRMKNISLGYDFPKSWIKMFRMSQMNLKINMTNPFLIYSDKKLKGQDPEFYKAGGVSMPTPKQFTMTLNVRF